MGETVLIMGAAGRDFHNFNTCFRDDPYYRVAAFTAAQIPGIAGRRYPPELAGRLYPRGIPIQPEERLAALIREEKVNVVAFAYSDIPHIEVMHRASRVLALGADFLLLGGHRTLLPSIRPVVAICGVRTGCGKSPTTREVVRILQAMGIKAVVVRHPMPYGDLRLQRLQRFATGADLDDQKCTIEEREEYEPLLAMGVVVYAGIDYRAILDAAETEAEVIVWDGGNNDLPFFAPDIHIVLCDPHRAGDELTYYPGESNLLSADIVIIPKVDSAPAAEVARLERTVAATNPEALLVLAELPLAVSCSESIRGKRVLAIEDGPTLTHGGMSFGAATLAARRWDAATIVDPRPFAVGSLAETFRTYPHLIGVLPAMGYSPRQLADLEKTIAGIDCDLILSATPIRLGHLIRVRQPLLEVSYRYRDHRSPTLEDLLRPRLKSLLPARLG
jgi:predicted GTPase